MIIFRGGSASLRRCRAHGRWLLEAGANVALPNRDGRTPMHMACAMGNAVIARLLMQFGARATDQDAEVRPRQWRGRTVWRLLAPHTDQCPARCTAVLLLAQGTTPLMCAVRHASDSTELHAVLPTGGSCLQRDARGMTAPMFAGAGGNSPSLADFHATSSKG
jgi:ankyrin repeat protein